MRASRWPAISGATDHLSARAQASRRRSRRHRLYRRSRWVRRRPGWPQAGRPGGRTLPARALLPRLPARRGRYDQQDEVVAVCHGHDGRVLVHVLEPAHGHSAAADLEPVRNVAERLDLQRDPADPPGPRAQFRDQSRQLSRGVQGPRPPPAVDACQAGGCRVEAQPRRGGRGSGVRRVGCRGAGDGSRGPGDSAAEPMAPGGGRVLVVPPGAAGPVMV